MIRNSVLLFVALLMLAGTVFANQPLPGTNVADLEAFAAQFNEKWESWRGPEFEAALLATDGIYGDINADPNRELMGIRPDGTLVIAVLRNVDAALSTRTDLVQVGGVSGYDLDGSTSTGLYHWDGSAANPSHPEFVGRITIGDGAGTSSSHANHTAGTMMASGVNANAKGMATGAHLTTHDYDNDQAEMAIAATEGMKVSSHSYGFGDSYNGGYDEWAQGYDIICHDAPHYTPVIAAGNLGSGSFGTLYTDVCGKNSIAVGNVQDVSVYNGPASVVINSSSSVGPPDDGRVKPDIVGNGTSLYSCTSSSYTTMTGTSMSSPNIAGSLFLMYELYEQTHGGQVPLSSTMRAVMFNTADECGPADGPDFKYGWGLMNTQRACDLIASDEVLNPNAIGEYELSEGAVDEYTFSSDGTEDITVTVVWTDPEGALWAPVPLVNDLDVEVEDLVSGDIYYPWKLNGNNPSAAATTGDNDVDNVEQIWIENPGAGTYTVRISHEGNLQDGMQAYSLVVRGLTGGDAPQYILNLSPIYNYIAPGGGMLTYDVNFRHTTDATVPGVMYWNMVTLPNGNPYGPVFQYPFTVQPFQQISRELALQIPGFAPGGVYEFIGNVGVYPNDVYVTDSFEMIKFGNGADALPGEATQWPGTGFETETASDAAMRTDLPSEYSLSEAYPNPFNPTTSMTVTLPEAADLNVQVYNLNGRLVATLAEGRMQAGTHSLTFNGNGLASGVYFVKAMVPGQLNATQKLVLMK
ncbi:S8 family serine peptidase [bacterium]|nr:S8 family serine peptidase [bacterium]